MIGFRGALIPTKQNVKTPSYNALGNVSTKTGRILSDLELSELHSMLNLIVDMMHQMYFELSQFIKYIK